MFHTLLRFILLRPAVNHTKLCFTRFRMMLVLIICYIGKNCFHYEATNQKSRKNTRLQIRKVALVPGTETGFKLFLLI